jgi:hypothetical protein
MKGDQARFGWLPLRDGPALNRDRIAADWEGYFRDAYETSPALREFWAEHGSEWFASSHW